MPGPTGSWQRLKRRLVRTAGGRKRARVIVLLAAVLALDTADVSMIGAVAGRLERALSLSNTELGLLAAAPSLLAAVATIPAGILTDRVNRVRLMTAAIVLWCAAMVLSGLATSFAMLLLTRIALGAATAVAGPAIASLVGDFFGARERARVYGLILSGELVGAGFGFLVSGEFSSALGWRAAFFVLAVPSVALAVALWRLLPEPARGGADRLRADAPRDAGPPAERDDGAPELSLVQEQVGEEGVAPDEHLVLTRDPERLSLWAATRVVLRVPTNRMLILASALGYFYLNGIQTFALVYFRGHFHLAQSVATLLLALLGAGALVGVLTGGRVADRLVADGRISGRIEVGAVGAILAAVMFLPALLSRSLALALPLYVLAAAALAARNPALDAARLDVMHHLLWGRAEAVRTLLRRTMVAVAPLLFGFLADLLAHGPAAGTGQRGFGARASAPGLQDAFLILLVALPASGLLTWRARSSYPTDVASAAASEAATRR